MAWLGPEGVILVKEKVLKVKVAASFIISEATKQHFSVFGWKTNPGMRWQGACRTRGTRASLGAIWSGYHERGHGGGDGGRVESWAAAFAGLTSMRF